MMYAYDKNQVSNAQNLLGTMLDYAVQTMGYSLAEYYSLFLFSKYAKKIEKGDSGTIMGKSGIELCHDVLEINEIDTNTSEYKTYQLRAANSRSPEYWTGWAVAYYQWNSSLTFREINENCSIEDVFTMYYKYHEMDILQFVDTMNAIYKSHNTDTRLKKVRKSIGLSQRDLAELTGIPLKTIQQYEQRQKNINHARVDYLVNLSRALSCDIDVLLEKVP